MRTRLACTARLAAAALTGGVLAAAAGCTGSSGGGATPTDSAPPSRTLTSPSYNVGHPGTDWPTYGHDFARTGVAANMAPAGPLSVSWRARLDGAVYGQPLLVGSTVIAATENDSIYALDQATGKVIWRTNVGTPVPLASRAATSTRSASPARRSTTRPTGSSTPWRRPPDTTTC